MKTSYEITPAVRWLITLTVILAAVIEVLDMTIVNVSLPNMMGALGANTEQITWVLTSYIVAGAICMPLTGFLIGRFGQKRLLLTNIIGFLIASVMCGASTSLFEIVLFRTLQGAFGAALIPLSQLILREIFPPEEQGKAMAIWGIGIMTAPVLGPTLGGYITEILSWRWVFYINVPVCLFCVMLGWQLLRETPVRKTNIDWLGMFLMAVGIGCLQFFLDRGNQEDWFDSYVISGIFIIWVVALTVFIRRGWRIPTNIINLQLFRDRNFSSGCALMALYAIGVFGTIALQPIMLENFMGYSAKMSGLIMAPRGVASAIVMALAGRLFAKVDPRHLMAAGILISAFGTWLMSTFTLTASFSYMAWTGVVQGVGLGLFFVPLSIAAFGTLAPKDAPVAAGLFNFARNLGSSVGISLVSTMLTRDMQQNWNRLGGHIQIFNANLQAWLQKNNWTIHDPVALHQLSTQLANQAAILSLINIFWFIAVGFLCMLPMVFIMNKPIVTANLAELGH